jgi:lambda repressor-like predicted transcriptional regulator
MDMLDRVRSRLAPMKGQRLRDLSAATGMSYDTLLRIRDEKTDPPYSKVSQLCAYFSKVRK